VYGCRVGAGFAGWISLGSFTAFSPLALAQLPRVIPRYGKPVYVVKQSFST
jgi:hypothetical protein